MGTPDHVAVGKRRSTRVEDSAMGITGHLLALQHPRRPECPARPTLRAQEVLEPGTEEMTNPIP